MGRDRRGGVAGLLENHFALRTRKLTSRFQTALEGGARFRRRDRQLHPRNPHQRRRTNTRTGAIGLLQRSRKKIPVH
jgi:hypothetical protein